MIPRVLHLVTSLDCGGLESLVVDCANVRNRHDAASTFVCCLDKAGVLARRIKSNAVVSLGAIRARRPFDLLATRRLRGLLRGGLPAADGFPIEPSRDVAVLHCHNMAAWQYGVIASVGTGTAVVYTQHGANVHNVGAKNRIRVAILSRFTRSITAVSNSTADAMALSYGLVRSDIRVIPNGIETKTSQPGSENVRNDILTGFGVPSGMLVAGSVGRLAPEKGYDRLVGVWKSVTEQVGNAVLLLVGDGPERANLARRARDSGVADKVFFAGYREDIPAVLRAMDLFLLPSRNEGLSVALLEAMAAGVPVAVTGVGDSREVVSDGCGTVLPDDESHWAGTISGLLNDASRGSLREMLLRASRRVEERYSLGAVLDAYERIYRDAGATAPVVGVGDSAVRRLS